MPFMSLEPTVRVAPVHLPSLFLKHRVLEPDFLERLGFIRHHIFEIYVREFVSTVSQYRKNVLPFDSSKYGLDYQVSQLRL